MTDLAGALHKALSERYAVAGIKTPATARRGLTARMNALEKQFTHPGDRKGASTARAARAAGISARTWRDWRADRHPPSARLLAKLEAAYQKIIIQPKFKAKVNRTGAPNKVTIRAEVWWNGYRNRKLYRTIKFTNMRRIMTHVIRAWVAQGPDAAAVTFETGVADKESVPEDPGIQFAGDNVEIEFP